MQAFWGNMQASQYIPSDVRKVESLEAREFEEMMLDKFCIKIYLTRDISEVKRCNSKFNIL